jgi:hypothetical protein
MRNAECGVRNENYIPHSAFRTPHSSKKLWLVQLEKALILIRAF